MIYGSSAMTTDGGKSWTKSKVSHLDFGGVDWADTGNRLLALRHESGGMLTTSDDRGATWKDLEKGFSGCGVFDSKTFVATKAKEQGIFRSTDAGATWTQVFAATPTAGMPVVFKGNGYWATASGQRVLAVARARHAGALPDDQRDIAFDYLGLAALRDPVRPGVPEAVAECARAGIRTVMITGDFPGTALAIARATGLDHAGGCITGPELEAMDDAELARRIPTVSVFARVVPQQKLRIVRALKANEIGRAHV